MAIMGIYEIKNVINNKVYIGSSKNINKRWNKHKSLLKNNKHFNLYLQNSWNKNGENYFKFSIIEIIDDINKLFDKEKYWIYKKKSLIHDFGYNIDPMSEVSNIDRSLNIIFKKDSLYKLENNKTIIEDFENILNFNYNNILTKKINDIFT